MTKKLYIAAPFFNPDQLGLVQFVERAIDQTRGLNYYSPRVDGVLKDMAPSERKAAGPKLFALNVRMIRECDAVLALKDYSDTGTTWETGFAYGIEKPVFGYKTSAEPPLNIMVSQCFNATIYSANGLLAFLRDYANGAPLDKWAQGIDLKDTY
jgi:nucleoside 2-deoxyribosyltransferase